MNFKNVMARWQRRDRVIARRKVAERTTLARYGQGSSMKIVEGITYNDGRYRVVTRRKRG